MCTHYFHAIRSDHLRGGDDGAGLEQDADFDEAMTASSPLATQSRPGARFEPVDEASPVNGAGGANHKSRFVSFEATQGKTMSSSKLDEACMCVCVLVNSGVFLDQ